MVMKGKEILSSDLDIFGEDAGDDTSTIGDEYDIFGGAADSEEGSETNSEDTTNQESTDTTESTEGTTTETNTEGTTEDKDIEKTEGEDEVLDIDIENLFADIEAEGKGNPELEQLVDSLRTEISAITTERNILQKENSTLNEKLMSRVGDESNLGIYKGVITNLESNPKLMLLVKHLGNKDNESIKNKLVGVVTDILYDLTGEDVSDLINKEQSSKILAATGKTASSSVPETESREDEGTMDYEESISSLF